MRVEKLELELQAFSGMETVPEPFRQLLKEAECAMQAAYAPFSKFKVGAAVLLEGGRVVHGCNQENASYPEGLCAERVAFYAAGANYASEPPVAVAISCSHSTGAMLSPCGGCRQVMLEFENRYNRSIQLITSDGADNYFLFKSVSQLLPWGFDRKVLDKT